MYYQVSVKFDKPIEGAQEKKTVTEVYLFEAVSYTDAESSAVKKFDEIIPGGEFEISNITQFKIQTILNENDQDGKMFYLSTNTFLTEQEDGNFKKNRFKTLVFAKDLASAVTFLGSWFEGSMDETYVSSITESKILEIFRPEFIVPSANPYNPISDSENATF